MAYLNVYLYMLINIGKQSKDLHAIVPYYLQRVQNKMNEFRTLTINYVILEKLLKSPPFFLHLMIKHTQYDLWSCEKPKSLCR